MGHTAVGVHMGVHANSDFTQMIAILSTGCIIFCFSINTKIDEFICLTYITCSINIHRSSHGKCAYAYANTYANTV